MPYLTMLNFRGLIGNIEFSDITGPEFDRALRSSGFREAHNAHFFKRLRERAPRLGISTPNELTRSISRGRSREDESPGCLRHYLSMQAYIVYRPRTGEIITIRETRER